MSAQSPAWQDWIDRAHAVPLLDVAQKLGAKLKRSGVEWTGPCPNCGGTDRFSINTKLRVWNCRGAEGGASVIDLVMHARGCGFVDAVEIVTGENRPDRSRDETPEERAQREQARAEREARLADQRRVDEEEAAAKRRRDEEAVADVLRRAGPIGATQAEAYLRERLGQVPSRRLTGDLRFVPDLDYWGYAETQAEYFARRPDLDPKKHQQPKVLLATLPAMVAPARNVAGVATGVHQTYMKADRPEKWKPIGDVTRNRAKKMRGDVKGCMVRLGMIGETLCIGEGIEKTFGWHALGCGPEDVTIASALSLGNLAGSCTGTVDHPTARDPETGRPVKVGNGIPDMERPGVILPPDVKSVIIIVDSTSEPIMTRAKALTAARRFRAEGRLVTLQMSPPGRDFDEVALAQWAELKRVA